MQCQGNKTLYVDGDLLGPVPYLAICHYPGTNEFSLAQCDSEWELEGIAGDYLSPEKAMEAACYVNNCIKTGDPNNEGE